MSGLEEFAADLAQAAQHVGRRVGQVNRAAAVRIGDTYAKTARRSAKARQGEHMADTVQVEGGKGGMRQIVGPTAYWAFFQEHGTSSITGDNALREATDRHTDEWVADLSKIVEELL